MSARPWLSGLHAAALRAVHGGLAVERALGRAPLEGPVAMLAVGKAAGAMAEGALRTLGARVRRGHLTAPRGHAGAPARCVVHEASHPLPDAGSERAARDALAFARELRADETLLVLLSGGASALWSLPAAGLALADKRETTECLLRSPAEISQLNAVRKHLSAIKGGWLAAALAGVPSLTLALSDVRGDPPDVIGSGPMSPDRSRYADALAALDALAVRDAIPPAARQHLEAGQRGGRPETPKPGDPAFERAAFLVVASLRVALDAAERAAREQDVRVHAAGDVLYGEVGSLVEPLIARCDRARALGARLLVAGGEPTVRVRGAGRGGRAQQLALGFSLALEREGRREWTALFASTDGSDGPTDAAGAFADATLPARARALRLDPAGALERNDAHTLLTATGDLHRTGPTGTNVNDLALVALDPEVGAIG